ncbi:MAG: carboxypeptidase regulatory-like domain-containing protein [Deltaproteobacteria bacterium]|nr:carboxypeptidase regulatory-like domain-containing protein [Deltaproteobacteria bacterium]
MRRFLAWIAVTPLLLACSAGKDAGTPDELANDDASVGDGYELDGDPGQEFSLPEDIAPPCVGLKCQQKLCGGDVTTTVSGTVYDPAGKVPLYNVIVYVPNAPLDPFPKGVSCDKCGTITSGSPIVTALTDAKGRFVLKNVPVGKDIPLVMQVGKWRRKITIPEVKECVDNAITDKSATRLPRNRSEGDMPQMALVTGGCDELECLFRKIGISDSEYTSGSGKGAMHLYKGQGGGTISGITNAQPFWTDLAKMKQYDMIILSCECSEYPSNKGTDALNAMHAYANAGGRIFASHFHYYWFKSGPPDFQSTATWSGGSTGNPYLIDTGFPKGKSFSEWLVNVGASTTPGQITLNSVKSDLSLVNKSTSTRWIYKGPSSESVKYFSFNTPIGKPAESQCGRAVFSDIHVSNESGGSAFPGGCSAGDLSAQEKALEFLFFDLSSCIQDEGEPPRPPPPK